MSFWLAWVPSRSSSAGPACVRCRSTAELLACLGASRQERCWPAWVHRGSNFAGLPGCIAEVMLLGPLVR